MNKTMYYYLNFLNNNLKQVNIYNKDITPLAYLSNYIFDFETYSSEFDDVFSKRALEVCVAISASMTFEYQKDKELEQWYLIMCNMPFFKNKLDWGGSIRGAWWSLYDGGYFRIYSCGFYDNDTQIIEPILFNSEQWILFIEAMVNFALPQ